MLNLFQDLYLFVKRNKVEMLKRVQHDANLFFADTLLSFFFLICQGFF